MAATRNTIDVVCTTFKATDERYIPFSLQSTVDRSTIHCIHLGERSTTSYHRRQYSIYHSSFSDKHAAGLGPIGGLYRAYTS